MQSAKTRFLNQGEERMRMENHLRECVKRGLSMLLCVCLASNIPAAFVSAKENDIAIQGESSVSVSGGNMTDNNTNMQSNAALGSNSDTQSNAAPGNNTDTASNAVSGNNADTQGNAAQGNNADTQNNAVGSNSDTQGNAVSGNNADTQGNMVSGNNANTESGLVSGGNADISGGDASVSDGNLLAVSGGDALLMTFGLENPFAWYTENMEASEWIISTAEELEAFRILVNNGEEGINNGNPVDFTGKTIKLGNNITINEDISQEEGRNEWVPIGSLSRPFKGNFDGQGYIIEGLYITSNQQYTGLFGYVSGTSAQRSRIQNVKLTDSGIEGSSYVGGIAGYAKYAVFSNITISNVNVSGQECIGGMTGHIEYTDVQNCTAENTVSVTAFGSYGRGGGLLGYAKSASCTIEGCTNEAKQQYPNVTCIGGSSDDTLRIVYYNSNSNVLLQFDVGGGSWADYYYPGNSYSSQGYDSAVALYFEVAGEKFQFNTEYFGDMGVEGAAIKTFPNPGVSLNDTTIALTWAGVAIGDTGYTFDFTLEYGYNGGGTFNRRYIITPRGTVLENVKLSYGGDTYFAGDDSGYDYAIWHEGEAGDSVKMVFIKQKNTAESPAMYISSASANGYFSGEYYSGKEWACRLTGGREALNGSQKVDEGYYLYWALGTLPAGYSTMVSATEGVDQSGTPVRAFAPNIPTFVAGDNAAQIETVNFVMANLTGDEYTVDGVTVSVTEGSGITAEYIGSQSNPVPASGSALLPIEITIPAHTSEQEVNITVSATDNVGNTMTVVTTLDIRIKPSITNVKMEDKRITFDTANVDKYEIYNEGGAAFLVQVTGAEALGSEKSYTVSEYGTYYIYGYQGTLCVQCEVVVTEPVEETYYNLTYEYAHNGGYGMNQAVQTKNVRVRENGEISLTGEGAETANKTGWQFVGWNTDKDALAGLESITVSSDMTVYAIYSKTLTASFYHNDGTDAKTDYQVTLYNNTSARSLTIPQGPSRTGFQFQGWHTALENGRPLTGETVMLNTDRSYYAQWQLKPITVTGITENIQKAYDGRSISLTMEVSHPLPVTYQWYKDSQLLTGETGAVLQLEGTVADSGVYTCKTAVTVSEESVTAQRGVTVSISRASYGEEQPVISMNDYSYGGILVQPVINGVKESASYQFYYGRQNTASGGTQWTDSITSQTLIPGIWYMYAVVAQSENYAETTTDAVSFVIEKGIQEPPVLPVEEIAERQTTSITLKEVPGCEYSLDGENWQDSCIFTNLTQDTTYTFYQRKQETDYYKPSESVTAQFKTNGLYSVILPQTQIGYTLTAAQSSTSPVEEGGEYTFRFTLLEGYGKQDGFAVKVNDVPVTLSQDGTYTIENIEEDIIISVTGVADIEVPVFGEAVNVVDSVTGKYTVQVVVTDEQSGMGNAQDNITIQTGMTPVIFTAQSVAGGFRISFERTGTEDYVISAKDAAGNVALKTISLEAQELYTAAFLPESLPQTAPPVLGTAPASQQHWQYRKWDLPANPFTREGYVFCGWEYGGRLYNAGEIFTMPAQNVTFTAKWSISAVNTAIHGSIRFENGNVPQTAQIILWEGSSQIDVAQADSDGNFVFNNVENGFYTLEVVIPDEPVNQIYRENMVIADGQVIFGQGQTGEGIFVMIPRPAEVKTLEEKLADLQITAGGSNLPVEEIKNILENGSEQEKEELTALLREDAYRNKIREALEDYHALTDNEKQQVGEGALEKLNLLVSGTCALEIGLVSDTEKVAAPAYDYLLGLLVTPQDMIQQEEALTKGEPFRITVLMSITTLHDGRENADMQAVINAIKQMMGSGYTADTFCDITIVKVVNGSSETIRKTPAEIELQFLMSADMLAGSGHAIWRYHEDGSGNVTIENLTAQREGNVQKTESGKFSVFAPVYVTAPQGNLAQSGSAIGANSINVSHSEPEEQEGRTLDKVPKTGEKSARSGEKGIIIASMDMLVYKKKKEKEEKNEA